MINQFNTSASCEQTEFIFRDRNMYTARKQNTKNMSQVTISKKTFMSPVVHRPQHAVYIQSVMYTTGYVTTSSINLGQMKGQLSPQGIQMVHEYNTMQHHTHPCTYTTYIMHFMHVLCSWWFMDQHLKILFISSGA